MKNANRVLIAPETVTTSLILTSLKTKDMVCDFIFNILSWKLAFLIFLSGSLAGVFAQLLSYPFDVIKKKMQANQDNKTQ